MFQLFLYVVFVFLPTSVNHMSPLGAIKSELPEMIHLLVSLTECRGVIRIHGVNEAKYGSL